MRRIACRHCAYNLRGLTLEEPCPECGAATGDSVAGDYIRNADPRWIDSLAHGIMYMLLGVVVAVVLGAAGIVVQVMISPFVGTALMSCGQLMSIYGTWVLTKPDPRVIGTDREATARRVIRTCLIAGFLFPWLEWGATQLPVGSNDLIIALVVTVVIGGLGKVVGETAKMLYFERLAMRLPDDAIARRAHMLACGLGITLALLYVMAIGTTIVSFSPATGIAASNVTVATGSVAGGSSGYIVNVMNGASATPASSSFAGIGFSCFNGIVGICLLVFWIMAIVLMTQVRKALLAEAEVARNIRDSDRLRDDRPIAVNASPPAPPEA